MVLKPSNENFEQLRKKIEFPGKVTRAPEQDFLSNVDIYTDHWTALPLMYNFQPHQLANTCHTVMVVEQKEPVSYTHLTLPTNREV